MPVPKRRLTGEQPVTGSRAKGKKTYVNIGGNTEIQPGGGGPGPVPGTIYGFANNYNSGAGVTGGAGGSIVHVTTTTDNVSGSLRTALTTSGTRTIVFDVGGTFNLAGTTHVSARGNVTIAGETAPSPGVTVTGVGITFNSEGNVIYRHIRHRGTPLGGESEEYDPFASNNMQGLVIQNCSLSGARSETIGFGHGCKWVTVQECIIGPAQSPSTTESRGILFSADSELTQGISVFRTVIKSFYRQPAIAYTTATSTLSPGTTGDVANIVVHNVGLVAPNGTGGTRADGVASTVYHGAKANIRYSWYNTVQGMNIETLGQLFSQGNYSRNGQSMSGNVGTVFPVPANSVLPFTTDARAAATSVLASAGCQVGGRDAYDLALIAEINAVGI